MKWQKDKGERRGSEPDWNLLPTESLKKKAETFRARQQSADAVKSLHWGSLAAKLEDIIERRKVDGEPGYTRELYTDWNLLETGELESKARFARIRQSQEEERDPDESLKWGEMAAKIEEVLRQRASSDADNC